MDASLKAAAQSGRGEAAAVLAIERVRYPSGFFFGFAQRCFFASMTMDTRSDLAGLARRLSSALAPAMVVPPAARLQSSDLPRRAPAMVLLDSLARCAAGLQEAVGITVVGGAGLVALKRIDPEAGGERLAIEFATPSRLPESAAQVFEWVVGFANCLAAEPARDSVGPEEERSLEALMDDLRQKAPSGNNVRHWIRAALELAIPVRTLPLDIIQLGYGRHSRLFLRSASDAMPQIGAKLALNKFASAAMMRSAEIPVPQHEHVWSADEAAAASARIGFPLVVKPVNQARGKGVTAAVASESELLRAYDRAHALSRGVLIEQHMPGQEYRLLVVNGRLFWAYERIPARVFGDGRSTVAALIDQANRTRRPGPSNGFDLVAIPIDDELRETLADGGRTLATIPAAGESVRLQRAPSNARGGEIQPVFDVVHPDVAQIAERAARLFRLDIAGVDYLTPDISRSWREVGGAIIEVNNEPQISPRSRPDMHRALLKQLVPGGGRIPVSIVVGDDGETETEIWRLFEQSGIRAGLASATRIRIGSDVIAEGSIDPYRAARALTINTEVEAIVLFIDGKGMLRNGLPFEWVDILAIAGPAACNLKAFMSLARPHVRRFILSLGDAPDREMISGVAGALRHGFVRDRLEMAKMLAEQVRVWARSEGQSRA